MLNVSTREFHVNKIAKVCSQTLVPIGGGTELFRYSTITVEGTLP